VIYIRRTHRIVLSRCFLWRSRFRGQAHRRLLSNGLSGRGRNRRRPKTSIRRHEDAPRHPISDSELDRPVS
jgi:hypothetical protein